MMVQSYTLPWRRSLAIGACILTLISPLGLGGFALAGCVPSPIISTTMLITTRISSMAFALLGCMIIVYQPENRIGWLCLWAGTGNTAFVTISFFAVPCTLAGQVAVPGAAYMAWLIYSLGFMLTVIPLFILLPMLFPTGRFLSSRWQWLGIGGCSIVVFANLALGLLPDLRQENAVGISFPLSNPLGILTLPGWWYPFFRSIASLTGIGLALLGIVAMGLRLKRSTGDERQQLKWLAYFLATAVTVQLLVFELPGAFFYPELFRTVWYDLIILVVLFGFPLTIGIAIFKYRLYAIDLVINRTLVYGGLTLMVVLFYTVTVGLLSLLFHTTGSLLNSLVATGIVAVLFQPVRERLQRSVNRMMFGERDDPYAVLAQLSRRLQTTAVPNETLTAIVETIAATLKLPAIAIELLEHDKIIGRAAVGQPTPNSVVLPLRYQNEEVGRLIVSPRAANEQFTDQELQLLAAIAGQTGAVASATRLTLALQQSREALVLAREEERRRIRRDLHDGLGPTLASQTLKLDALHDLLIDDPQAATAEIARLKEQTQRMVSDIRRLVYELRPPALDELGLSGALQAHIAQLQGTQNGLEIMIATEPMPLPPLPAATEVAVYRIVLEAVTNVIRHARASMCHVRLSITPDPQRHDLLVCITDNGIGLPKQLHTGVGFVSIRERAEELGGTCTIESSGDGSRVVARLPLRQELHR